MHKDLLFLISRELHRYRFMKCHKEYYDKYSSNKHDMLKYKGKDRSAYNWRYLNCACYRCIYRCCYRNGIGYINEYIPTSGALAKRHFYSSGLNNIEGYL